MVSLRRRAGAAALTGRSIPARRPSGRLSESLIAKLRDPGRYPDLLGLALRIHPGGRRSWEQVVSVRSERRVLGLGGYPVVPLADARAQALRNAQDVLEGKGVGKVRSRSEPTFAEAADRAITLRARRWRGARTEAKCRAALETHVFPAIGRHFVSDVRALDVADLLDPLFRRAPAAARVVRAHIDLTMRWAILHKYRLDNPVGAWLDSVLPVAAVSVQHQRALPPQDVRGALERVCAAPLVYPATKRLFCFLVLTASRGVEAAGARWCEIDWERRVWVIPAERMKMRRPHRVPLSAAALGVLAQARVAAPGSDVVFVPRSGEAIATTTLVSLLRRHRVGAVPHGFRASFGDWCAETGVDRDVSELALAHLPGSMTEHVYFRTDLLERRRPVMEGWGRYVGLAPD